MDSRLPGKYISNADVTFNGALLHSQMKLSFIRIDSIRFKLITSLIGVSLFIGMISLLVGGNLLYRAVLDEANHRIRQDLNVARVIYDERVDSVRMALEITASDPGFLSAVASGSETVVLETARSLAHRLHLDFWTITDSDGQVVHRMGLGAATTKRLWSTHPLMVRAIAESKTVAGTVVLDHAGLMTENPALAGRSNLRIHPSPDRTGTPARHGTAALTTGAAVPIGDGRSLSGFIYGGYLLNGSTGIVDKIGETVFKNETYKGIEVGTATIFHQDLRIATSVKDSSGNRALGTTASREVAQRVLKEGKKWTARARVLNDWYITAYEPITDIAGQRVGMLYVGVLEAKYRDVRKRAIAVFAAITLAGVGIAIVLGWLFTGRIMRPISDLIRASTEISKGNFSPHLGPVSRDDIGQLQNNFLIMAEALKERDERQKAESEIRLIQSEKQASVGNLAAGVAHEINNPLTAVLTFTHLILRRKDLPEEVRADLETVAAQTERVRQIVKSLLDFSRQTALKPESTNINRLVEDSARLMENQALIKGVALSVTKDDRLPRIILDRNQCQSVLINMIINALDATDSGGAIEIETLRTTTDEGEGVEIRISDTGCGIGPDHMDKIFDPFFTTKEMGKGTGLGLAVSAGIIQRHGGTITVHSKPASGTTFTLWLPHRPAHEPSDGNAGGTGQ